MSDFVLKYIIVTISSPRDIRCRITHRVHVLYGVKHNIPTADNIFCFITI